MLDTINHSWTIETPRTRHSPIETQNLPTPLSHDQEIRLHAANETLTEIRRWIRNTPQDTYETYATPDNHRLFDSVTFQKISHILRSLRNVEKVLPLLTPEQKMELTDINAYYIPLFLNLLENYEVEPGLQEPILDILSMEGITMEQVKRLEKKQNALNLAMIGNDEGMKKIEEIKKGWTRYVH